MAKPNARAVALDLLQAVLRHKKPLDEALAAHPALARLDPRDRGFARMLAATCVRRLGEIDQAIAPLLATPLPGKASAVADALRLGACQLLFLGTPPHAAVSETVDLVAGLGALAGYKGLTNALLRRLDRERPATDPWLNTPLWLAASWTAAYGETTARAIAAAHLVEAPLDLSVKADALAWAERLKAEILPTGSLRLHESSGAIEALPGFADGGWWVQDAAAALPAKLLGTPNGVIDLCAAPGGKTAELAAAGIAVTAVDRSPQRLRRLKANLDRLGLAAEIVEADAARWRPETLAEAVLLDAPCSATGTIRRHPDLPWLKNPEDLPKLTGLQDRLLKNAVAMTRPGGVIVYAVCSLQPEEGPARIAGLLSRGAPVTRMPIELQEVGGLAELLTPAGELRSLPCHLAERGGMDGFYACRLRRT
ncbi:MAG: RsmB/NOP family class I SAM-dependent RNA methyltransferase [Dongiales bacterium]